MEQQRQEMLSRLRHGLKLTGIDLALLDQALTHSSYSNEGQGQRKEHNERLEFLGDAVLSLAISQLLYRGLPGMREGDLTRLRASLVCEESLARKARELRLGDYLLLGRGEEAGGGRKRASVLADCLEAVFGALYLSQGFAVCQTFIEGLFPDALGAGQQDGCRDAKTALQEAVQGEKRPAPIIYEILKEEGPDHAKVFWAGVRIGDALQGEGQGHSKKEAEQEAARDALRRLGYLAHEEE